MTNKGGQSREGRGRRDRSSPRSGPAARRREGTGSRAGQEGTGSRARRDDPASHPWPDWMLFGAVGLLALVVRLVFLMEAQGSDLFGLLLGDARAYDLWARGLAGGDWIGSEVFYQAPLYPYFLGVLYAVLGHDLLLVRIVQTILGSAGVVLLALAGSSFLGRREGAAAGLLMALYPPAVFFDGTIQKTALAAFWTALLLFLLARHQERPGGGRSLAAGAALGLLALTRENGLIFVPVILAWILWEHREILFKRRASLALLFLAGLALVLFPVALRNGLVGGEFHITTSQSGSNFYIGNNPQATGAYQPLRAGRGDALYERQDAVNLAEYEAGRPLSPGEVSSHWFGKSFDYIRTQPGDWLLLMGKKTLLALNAVELGDSEDLYTYAEISVILKILNPVLHWGVLFPLAVLGLILTWRDRRRLVLLYALILLYAAGLVLFFVMGRYRFPLAPMTALFAGAGIIRGYVLLRAWWEGGSLSRSPDAIDGARHSAGAGGGRRDQDARRLLVPGGAALILAAVLSNWPILERNDSRMTTHANVAYALIDQEGKPGQALEHLDRVLEIDPDNANGLLLYAVALEAMRRHREAEPYYLRAMELDPNRALVHFRLADLRRAQGRYEEAAELYQSGLALDPVNVPALNSAATTLARLGRFDEALAKIEAVLIFAPESPDAQYNQALILAQAGREGEAAEGFRALLAIDPGSIRFRQALSRALLREGHPQEAIQELEILSKDPAAATAARLAVSWVMAVHEDPEVRNGGRALSMAEDLVEETGGRDPQALKVKAAALAELGRFPEARETATRAMELAGKARQAALYDEITEQMLEYREGRPHRVREW